MIQSRRDFLKTALSGGLASLIPAFTQPVD